MKVVVVVVGTPKPRYKFSLSDTAVGIIGLILVSLFLGAIKNSIEEHAVKEYMEDNYEHIYDDAYSEGYDMGYEDGRADAYEEWFNNPQLINKCYNCSNFYDPVNDIYYGFGLCYDCGRSTLTDCVFCMRTTFSWGEDAFFTVCPDCLGDALENTNLEDLLFEFNENR